MTACLSNATVENAAGCGFISADSADPGLLECHFLERKSEDEDATFSRIFGIS